MADGFIASVRRRGPYLALLLIIPALAVGLWAVRSEQKTRADAESLLRQLTEYHQTQLRTKLAELERLKETHSGLEAEMNQILLELDRTSVIKSLDNMTIAEIAETIRRPGLERRLPQLKDQETALLVNMEELEQDISELQEALSRT